MEMNERLKEIAVKAQVEHCVSHVRLQEFAELIIQDSIQTLRNNGYDDAAQCLHDVHFGMDNPV